LYSAVQSEDTEMLVASR